MKCFMKMPRRHHVYEITLTKRDAKKENPIPMCGVPYHSADGTIDTLVNNGYEGPSYL